MPTKLMDQRQLSPYHMSSLPSSFFSEELCFSSEKQVAFRKDLGTDSRGIEGVPLISGSKPVSSSPIKKLAPMGGNTVECLELPQCYVFKDQNTKIGFEHHLEGTAGSSGSRNLWRAPNEDQISHLSTCAQPASQLVERNKVNFSGDYYENALFSSSVTEIFNRKLCLSTNDVPFGRSMDTPDFGDNEPFESSKETEEQTIGNLLPDDEDLLSGIIDDHDYIACRNNGVDFEDDLFCSGGGMELEAGNNHKVNMASDFVGRDPVYGQPKGSFGPFAGEHAYGERPSRSPFVRNINSNVVDAEDIPSENYISQGTLVVFNLNSSVSNDELRQIFSAYGDVKEIRETPHKHHYRFVEFYDVRAAEAAFRALNKHDIAGNRIKLVPSRPGGAKRCLMQQLCPELDQNEASGCQRVGPSCTSPPESFGSQGTKFDSLSFQELQSSAQPLVSSFMDTAFHGSSTIHSSFSPMKASVINGQSNQSGTGNLSHSIRRFASGSQCMPGYHPHSLPEYHGGIVNGIPFNSPRTMPSMDNCRPAGGFNNGICEACAGSLNNHRFEHNEVAFGILGNGSGPTRGHMYHVNSSDTHHRPSSAMVWQNPPILNSIPSHPPIHGYPGTPSNLPNTLLSLYNHPVGSAPTVNPSIWDRQHGYSGDTLETTAFHPGSLGNMGFPGSSPVHAMERAPRRMLSHASGNCPDFSSSSAHTGSPHQQRRHNFHGKNMSSWNRRNDSNANQADKKQYELDIDRILHGEDSRTTLMLKNIPNKYTSKMLLTTIDENHRGTYDFIYLPIDFKNKCNMGYAFINMIDPRQIVPFYKAFNGKKWEKFNSEKVALLAYARIQGRQALIGHFQNSSLMNEDKRCRPILFHTDGPNAGDQEPFPMGSNIRSRPGRWRSGGSEESNDGSPSTSTDDEETVPVPVPVPSKDSQ